MEIIKIKKLERRKKLINKVEICGVNTSKLPILSNEEKKELLEKINQLEKRVAELEKNVSEIQEDIYEFVEEPEDSTCAGHCSCCSGCEE